MATIFSQTVDSNDTGWGGYSIRLALRITGNAQDQVRVTLQGNSASGFSLDNCSIGISPSTDSTDPVDTIIGCTATPVPLLFAGSAAVSSADGTQKTSDWANLTGFTTSNFLVVVFDFVGTSSDGFHNTGLNFVSAGGPGATAFKAASDTYNVQSPTGFAAFNTRIDLLASIETQSAAAIDTSKLTQVIHANVISRTRPIGY
jgi:hypothetical protein